MLLIAYCGLEEVRRENASSALVSAFRIDFVRYFLLCLLAISYLVSLRFSSLLPFYIPSPILLYCSYLFRLFPLYLSRFANANFALILDCPYHSLSLDICAFPPHFILFLLFSLLFPVSSFLSLIVPRPSPFSLPPRPFTPPPFYCFWAELIPNSGLAFLVWGEKHPKKLSSRRGMGEEGRKGEREGGKGRRKGWREGENET